jgi:hypothetical protein
MPDVICPVCERTVSVPQDKAYFGSRIQCSECKAAIEVIDEFPLRVKHYVSGGARGWIAEWLDLPKVKEPIKPSRANQ